jgi:hypothetical protein
MDSDASAVLKFLKYLSISGNKFLSGTKTCPSIGYLLAQAVFLYHEFLKK